MIQSSEWPSIYKYLSNISDDYIVAVEGLASAKPAIEELVEDHYQEVNAFRDRPLDINWPEYLKIAAAGRYHLITVRQGGLLMGWAGYFLYDHLRHRGYRMAKEDWYYVRPAARGQGIGRKMFAAGETTLRERGVDRIIMSCKVQHDHSGLIEDMGFDHYEKTFTKLLGK